MKLKLRGGVINCRLFVNSAKAIIVFTFLFFCFFGLNISHASAATITATASSTGATISPLGAVAVTDGQSQTFTIGTTNSNTSIYDVLVDGYSVGAVSSYSFTNVTGTHSIQVYTKTVANAGDVYIDPSSLTNGDGTIGNPYNTFVGVTWTSRKGYWIKRGTTYTGQIAPSVDSVTIGAYGTGVKPILTNTGANTIFINTRSGTVIQDLDIRNTNTTALSIQAAFANLSSVYVLRCSFSVSSGVNSVHAFRAISSSASYSIHNIVLENNSFTLGSAGSAIQAEVYGSDFYDWIIRGNTFSNLKWGVFFYGEKASTGVNNKSPYGVVMDSNTFSSVHMDAIYIGTGLKNVSGHQNLIARNTATNIGDVTNPNVNAFQLSYVRGTVIERNTITNVSTSVPDGDGIIIDFAYVDNAYLSDGNTVRYNTVTGANTGSVSAGIDIYKGTNNFVYDNRSYGNSSGFSIFNAESTGNVFYNNVAYGNAFGINIDIGAPASTWLNNISSGNSSKAVRLYSGALLPTPPTETHNLFFGIVDITPDVTSLVSNPLFANASSNFNLQPLSPAIDAGTSVGLTSDYAGNPIYGTPDIGAYEYQPPHTIGTDHINIGAGARIYGDGKFRDVGTTSGTTADLIITPASGSFDSYTSTQTRPAWLDIAKADDESAIIWEANHKKWKESSTTLGATNTLHTIGDLENNKYYNVKVDDTLATANITGADCTDGVCKSNGSGKITFTYTGGYSTHTFDVSAGDNTAPTVTDNTNSKFHTDTIEVTLSLTTDENSTCHYSTNQSDVYAAMTAFTTTGTTAHSALVNNLTPGDYTYYAICRDGVGNDTNYTLAFEIAQRENETGTSDAKLKIDGNNEALDEDKKIYFDENEGRLKGQDNTIANGTVKIYKEGKKYATVDVDSDGSWSKKLSFGHDKTYTLKLKFYDQYGTLRDEKEYDAKVDTEKPKFTDSFPQTLTIQKDDKINFESTDDTGVDYYKIRILDNQGHIVRAWRKQTKSFYLIPENVLNQADTIVVRAYDKAGNYAEEKTHLNIGESQSNITNVDNNTPTDNSGNESSNQQAYNSTSKPNVCSYTVESGDSLWSIAKKVYGDAAAYPQIIENNKDKYTDIEAKLSIGQALTFGCQDNQTQQNTENNSSTDNANQQLQPQPQSQDQSKTFQWWNPFTW